MKRALQKTTRATLLLLVVSTLARGGAAPRIAPDIATDTKTWHDRRVARLKAEDGWLTLVGLHWLKEGANGVGSAAGSEILLPASAPSKLGVITLTRDRRVFFTVQPGVSLLKNDQPFAGGPVVTDETSEADVLRTGNVRLMALRRGNRTAVRVKDSQSPQRLGFSEIAMFPPNAAWKIDARFVPSPTIKSLSVPNVLGEVEAMTCPGTLIFFYGGKEFRLDPVIEEGENALFIIFADETNHTESYHSGRFLSAELPKDGHVTLDFNRAFNPPCAFTAFATCPLPPAQNRLPLRVTAGEKRYAKDPGRVGTGR